MPTCSVVLSEHQHDFVEALVQSGRYQNASEVLCEGLRLIEQRERLEAATLKVRREAADKGWGDVADDRLEDFIGQLGHQTAGQARTTE